MSTLVQQLRVDLQRGFTTNRVEFTTARTAARSASMSLFFTGSGQATGHRGSDGSTDRWRAVERGRPAVSWAA